MVWHRNIPCPLQYLQAEARRPVHPQDIHAVAAIVAALPATPGFPAGWRSCFLLDGLLWKAPLSSPETWSGATIGQFPVAAGHSDRWSAAAAFASLPNAPAAHVAVSAPGVKFSIICHVSSLPSFVPLLPAYQFLHPLNGLLILRVSFEKTQVHLVVFSAFPFHPRTLFLPAYVNFSGATALKWS